MRPSERQVASEFRDIRRDHLARYEWAAMQLNGTQKVLDIACGVGYGTHVLAEAGHKAMGMDIDPEAIEYARKHWAHPDAEFSVQDASAMPTDEHYDVAISFETVEHVEDPLPLLKSLRQCADRLLTSVPNEDVFPYRDGILYHHRHYTKDEFAALLREAGWKVMLWFGQEGPESEVEPAVNGRTLIAMCEPISVKSVAILGLGPSVDEYTSLTRRMGGKHKLCDETWGINANGSVFQCDRIFHMDDVRIQEIRAAAKPESNIAAMLEWMKDSKVPITTSRAHPDYPALEEFPLEEVLNMFDSGYFNSTAAYAVAYAVYIGVERISIFGCDFTYPNSHDAEKGRACVEFWLGMAADRGITIQVPKSSSLLDALNTHQERFYGYDTLDLELYRDKDKVLRVKRTEVKTLPTAEEIEEAYDHKKHPNALVEGS